jgi:hypothetical protein
LKVVEIFRVDSPAWCLENKTQVWEVMGG